MRTALILFLSISPLYALSYPFPPDNGGHAFADLLPTVKYNPAEAQKIILKNAPTLEKRICKKVFGQDRAVKETAEAVVRFAAGVNDPNSVIASLLYSGPSGVGKTELAKQLCFELYGSMSHFIRINMSEFSEAHTISRLIGSPPGYVGYGEGGQLTNALLANPYSIVLLDEIEKAHPQVLKLFLHVFDEGRFTSAVGEEVDCRCAVFISTSNILASEIASFHAEGYDSEEISEVLRPYFIAKLSPELFNRLNFIVFSPLTDAVVEQMVNRLLQELKDRVEKAKGISLVFDPTLVQLLVEKGIDPQLGARPLKRLIDKELATVVARAILDGHLQDGDVVKCSYQDGEVLVEFMLRFEEDRG